MNIEELKTLDKTMQESRGEVVKTTKNLKISSLDKVQYVPPEFLIEPYIQKNVINLIHGDPSSGKTTFYCKLTAMITSGQKFFDVPVPYGNVGILCEETTQGDLRKKIELCGGDVSKVFMPEEPYLFDMKSEHLEDFIKNYKLSCLIFDPYQHYLGTDVNMDKANEVRPILGRLATMCDKYKCTIIIVAHMNKQTKTQNMLYRAIGSIDLPAICRSVVHIDNDPEEDGNPWLDKKVLLHIKANNSRLGQTLKFEIVHHVEDDVKNVSLEFTGVSNITEYDLPTHSSAKAKTFVYEEEPLVQVFQTILAEHPEGYRHTYDDFSKECKRILSCVPYRSTQELTKKVGLMHKDLITKSTIYVRTGETFGKNIRGISIEKYKVPTKYNQKLDI